MRNPNELFEAAVSLQNDVLDGLKRSKEAMLRLDRIYGEMDRERIPKTRMQAFAWAIESAGQILKEHRV